VAGALILRRRGETLALLLAPLALVVAVSILGYGTPRFRVPAEIPLVVMAAIALETLIARLRRRGAEGVPA
jgi:hypothetical protein